VRAFGIVRNGKLMLACAETVEDATSLWKGKEKEVENLQAADFAEMVGNNCTRILHQTCHNFALGGVVLL
jgi:hypothetical protein